MAKCTVLTALLLILGWGTASWSQEEKAESEPFEAQAPAQQGADPFGPPKSYELHGSDASGGEAKSRGMDVARNSDLKETPVFLAEDWSQHSEKIHATLNGPLSEVGFEFNEVPLSEVASFLTDEYQVQVHLDTQALDDLGLSPDDTITANIRHVSLASGLKLMLKQHDLTYIIADEVLLITSEDEALARLSVRVYPVGDVLQPKEGQPAPTAAAVDDLIDVIITTCAVDTWADNGGGEAEIRAMQPGMLVISQTQAVHEEVANLLAALRRARQHELALPYAPVAKKAQRTPGGGFGGRGGAFGGGGRESSRHSKPEQEKSTTPEQSRGGGAF